MPSRTSPKQRSSKPSTARKIRLRVDPQLTPAEIRKLEARAAEDLRGLANYVSWLIAQDLAKNPKTRRNTGAKASDRRQLGTMRSLTRGGSGSVTDTVPADGVDVGDPSPDGSPTDTADAIDGNAGSDGFDMFVHDDGTLPGSDFVDGTDGFSDGFDGFNDFLDSTTNDGFEDSADGNAGTEDGTDDGVDVLDNDGLDTADVPTGDGADV